MKLDSPSAPDYEVIYAANKIHDGTRYVDHHRVGMYEAHQAALRAVVQAAQLASATFEPCEECTDEDHCERRQRCSQDRLAAPASDTERKDAARYRYLRENMVAFGLEDFPMQKIGNSEALDAAIDAIISERSPERPSE